MTCQNRKHSQIKLYNNQRSKKFKTISEIYKKKLLMTTLFIINYRCLNIIGQKFLEHLLTRLSFFSDL